MFCWSSFSQVYADVALLQVVNGSNLIQQISNSLDFLEVNLWNEASGGFFAECSLDGSVVDRSVQFVDDNAFAGLVYLLCHRVGDRMKLPFSQRCLPRAILIAQWLMENGWDDSFGGGFWWNTLRPFKPTNSNSLAVVFFAELFDLTKTGLYLSWASKTAGWMESILFNPNVGLFQWYVNASGVNPAMFAYENALMVRGYALLSNDGSWNKSRELDLTNALLQNFWSNQFGIFMESTISGSVSTVLSGWASLSLLESGHSDTICQSNVAFINRHLRDASTGAAFTDCFPGGDGRRFNDSFYLLDTSWLQALNAFQARLD